MIDMENEYDADWTDPDLVYSGTKVFNSFLYGLLDKGTSYTVVAFGVSAAGEKTSDVFSVEVVTSASVSPSDNEITQTVSDISDSGAVVTVTTSNYNLYYADVQPAASIEGMSDDEIFRMWSITMEHISSGLSARETVRSIIRAIATPERNIVPLSSDTRRARPPRRCTRSTSQPSASRQARVRRLM